MTRHDTQTIDIAVEPALVHDFLADGANLPRWAIGFAKAVERDGDHWVVSTGAGDRIPTRVISDNGSGTVDFVMNPAHGVSVTAFARVTPFANGSLFSFTQMQSPGAPDAVFDAQVLALTHELIALKALLEVQCPL